MRDRRKHVQTRLDRVVWGVDYPENIVSGVNFLAGLWILNPAVKTLPLSIFGSALLRFIPSEGAWGAFLLFIGICHGAIRYQHENRRARRVMCAIAFCIWLSVWVISIITDWRSLGSIILFVLVLNAWVAFRRLAQRRIEGLWYAQRRV